MHIQFPSLIKCSLHNDNLSVGADNTRSLRVTKMVPKPTSSKLKFHMKIASVRWSIVPRKDMPYGAYE